MIRYLFASQLERWPLLADSMYRDRTVQFRDRLKWDVQVDHRGWERDEFDAVNPLYLIWECPDGRHGASMRVLPTVGRTMAEEVFGDLAMGREVRGPFIWECTRFCIAPEQNATAQKLAGALMLAGQELGLQFGLTKSVGVYDARMTRIYRRIGWAPEKVGEVGSGRDRICLGLWSFGAGIRDQIAEKAGLDPRLGKLWFDLSFPKDAPGAALAA